MDHEFHSIVEKLAILEGRISPEGKPVTHLKQEKPALFSFVKPVAEAVKAVAEEKVSEETSDDILSKVKNSLVDYLKNAEDSIKQDKDLLAKKKEDLDIKKKELKDLDLQQKQKEKEKQEELEEVEDQKADLMNKTLERAAEHGQEIEDDLQIGDRVVVKGPNEYNGLQGDIVDVGRSGAFVIVDIDGDMVSLHSSDVECLSDYNFKDDWGNDDEELDEDPAQEDPGAVAPITSINPTYEGTDLPFVESFMLDEVTECSINGDADRGYEIRRGSKALPTRFNDVEHARMAAELFKNRLAKQKEQDDSADYIDEK